MVSSLSAPIEITAILPPVNFSKSLIVSLYYTPQKYIKKKKKVNQMASRLETILKHPVKSKHLRAKLLNKLNLYVTDLIQVPQDQVGRIASIEVRAKEDKGEIVVSYCQTLKEYDEKRIKQIQHSISLFDINFSVTYMETSPHKITQVDYTEYKGSSTSTSPARTLAKQAQKSSA